jgi:hypothetical protein
MRLVLVLLLMLTACEMSHDLAGCGQEVTLFAVNCEGKVDGGTCQGKLGYLVGRVQFVAFPDRQEVVTHTGTAVKRLEDCAVQDWRTWTCTDHYPDSSTMTRWMNNGQLTQYYAANRSGGSPRCPAVASSSPGARRSTDGRRSQRWSPPSPPERSRAASFGRALPAGQAGRDPFVDLDFQPPHRVRGELTPGRELPPTLQTPECRPRQFRARADLTAS